LVPLRLRGKCVRKHETERKAWKGEIPAEPKTAASGDW
jgi:hypothetical protein